MEARPPTHQHTLTERRHVGLKYIGLLMEDTEFTERNLPDRPREGRWPPKLSVYLPPCSPCLRG